ncbi:hypothetical protein J1N35_032468 [Gossypium stocksii]|uniref:Uncharacterized protein n=1 Tax=Gossypium stocksii TaxID=47602 RepID=A0A9D3V3S6_9ROSI|nr:hypothetical protein J1N35_032468 [Gossypium stocksii]
MGLTKVTTTDNYTLSLPLTCTESEILGVWGQNPNPQNITPVSYLSSLNHLYYQSWLLQLQRVLNLMLASMMLKWMNLRLWGKISLPHMTRFMTLLMLWDCKKIFLGAFMLMVLRSHLQFSKEELYPFARVLM